jgi:hypothetical protein
MPAPTRLTVPFAPLPVCCVLIHDSGEEGAQAQVVVVATTDARLAVVDLESGQHLGE